MSKNYYTPTLCISLLTSLHAMEHNTPKKAVVIAELTHIKKPTSVMCLSDNTTVAILGKDGCGLYDFTTNKEIVKFHTYNKLASETTYATITVHQDKTKLAIVRKIHRQMRENIVEIEMYNLKTYKKTCEYKNLKDNLNIISTFNPSTSNLMAYDCQGYIQSFDDNNEFIKKYFIKDFPNDYFATPDLIFHPTQQEMILCGGGSALIFEINEQSKQLIKKKNISVDHYIFSSRYSPDGSLIAHVAQFNGCIIVDPQDKSYVLDHQDIEGTAFDSTSSVIATIKNKNLYYWNVHTKKLITSERIEERISAFTCVSAGKNNSITFSENGTTLIVAAKDKCFAVKVPFEIHNKNIYVPHTKNQCTFVYWMLQNYDKMYIPQELNQLMVKYLLDASKYQS